MTKICRKLTIVFDVLTYKTVISDVILCILLVNKSIDIFPVNPHDLEIVPK